MTEILHLILAILSVALENSCHRFTFQADGRLFGNCDLVNEREIPVTLKIPEKGEEKAHTCANAGNNSYDACSKWSTRYGSK